VQGATQPTPQEPKSTPDVSQLNISKDMLQNLNIDNEVKTKRCTHSAHSNATWR